MNKDKKFLFDVNIFDAPEIEEVPEDLPPPPPTFSEEELAAAKDMAFEQGRQQGQKEQIESREQYIAVSLDKIAQDFAHLFSAETLRENLFEKEALRLAVATLDLLYPSLNAKIGRDEVMKVIEKTLSDHRKTKEILIYVSSGMKGEVETLIARIRATEHEEVLWRVLEDPTLSAGDCRMEWGDGGAVRDSIRTARDIRQHIEGLFGEKIPETADLSDSDIGNSDVLSMEKSESVKSEGEDHER